MFRRYLIAYVGLLAFTLVPSSVTAAVVFVEDFTGFSNSISASPAGGDQNQFISASVGTDFTTNQGMVPGIDGSSLFVNIDTSAVNPIGSGSYGGGIQTDLTSPFMAGDLTSSDPTDYDIVFDVAANGFAPNNVDIFLQFRNEFNDNQLGAQLSINQNSPAFAPFIPLLAGNDPCQR